MKECPFLILPVPVKGRVYSSADDTITEIASTYVSMHADCSSAVGTSIGKCCSTCLASQQQHSPNSINMIATATARATAIPIPAGQMRNNARNCTTYGVKLHE